MHLNSYIIQKPIELQAKHGIIQCYMKKCPLMAGEYTLQYKLFDEIGNLLDQVDDAAFVTVAAGDYYGSGRRPASDRCSVLVDYDFASVAQPLEGKSAD